jgi:putative hemolysin
VNIDSFIFNYILLGILLFLSFYFSGSEAAIFSLNRLERNALKETKSYKKNKIISYLLDNQDQLLISILTGNMIVNIFASSIGSIVGAKLFGENSGIISIIGMTLLLLLMGELTPKRIAVNHSKTFTRITAAPLFYLHHALTPIRFLLNHISVYILEFFPNNMEGEKDDEHALVLSTVELGFNQAILKNTEYSLFKSYLTLKKKSANSVMTPRSELKTLSSNLTMDEVLDLIANNRGFIMNSTILLHKNDNDNIVGWVPVSSILEYKFREDRREIKIKTISQKFHVVPESKKLPLLIAEMREADITLALILDEYGGTAGILWFRNIIEDAMRVYYNPIREVFGENRQNYIVIPGSMAIEDLEEFIEIDSQMDAVTAAGFFLENYGSIPTPGDEIRYNRIGMKVLEMEGNRILTLKIEMSDDI